MTTENIPIGNRLDILHSAVRALRRTLQQNIHLRAEIAYENEKLEKDIEKHEAEIKRLTAGEKE